MVEETHGRSFGAPTCPGLQHRIFRISARRSIASSQTLSRRGSCGLSWVTLGYVAKRNLGLLPTPRNIMVGNWVHEEVK